MKTKKIETDIGNVLCKHFPKQRRSDTVLNRIEVLALLWVNMSNPNGDPRNGGAPRVTPSGHGYISADSFKRHCRNALELYFDGKLLIPMEGAIGDVIAEVIAASGKTVKDFTGTNEKVASLVDLVLAHCIDMRLFGGVGTKPVQFSRRGSVKIHLAESVDPIHLVYHKGTRKSHASSKEAKEGASQTEIDKLNAANSAEQMNGIFTERVLVHRALYRFVAEIDGEQAKKNKVTYGDLDDMLESWLSMYSWFGSASRSDVTVRRMDVWEHSHPRGSITAGLLPMMTTTKSGDNDPQAFEDYAVETPKCPPGVRHWTIRPEDVLQVAMAAE